MKFWLGSQIRVPVRQLTPGDLSIFDLNPEGGVTMTTLKQDAIAAAGPGGFFYEVDVVPSSVLERNHKKSRVDFFYTPLEKLVLASPDYKQVLTSRFFANRKGQAVAHKDLMRSLIGLGMLGAALDYVYAMFYVSKKWQFPVDVSRYLGFDGRFVKVQQSNLGQQSPDHPDHVEVLDRVEVKTVKVFATIWNLGCVRVLVEHPGS